MFSLNRIPQLLKRGLRWSSIVLLCCTTLPVLAYNTYLDNYNATHNTQGTRLSTCGLCHYNFNGGGARTPYGEDYRLNNYDAANILTLDSDGDTYTNAEEAAANVLTIPGLSCNNLSNVLNAPANVADYVNPANLGCITQGQLPIANPNGPYVVVTGNSVNFSSAGSSDPDGTIVSYLWDFGGNSTSTLANPTVTYSLPFAAKFLVSLTVTDNSGNTATATTTVHVLQTANSPPTANAGAALTGVANVPVQFDGTGSTDPEGYALSYSWDFGDNTTGVGATPTHTYSRCGNYNVGLTVTDIVSLTGTASTTVTVSSSGIDNPVANAGGGTAGHYDGTVAANVQFDGSASADPDCTIAQYNWDFGDGTTGLGVNPTHSYTTAGDYVVSLTVTDNDSLTATATATVTIVNAGTLDGAALYNTNCGGCHGTGTNSTKIGATVARINSGISTVSSMSSLGTLLSTAEITAISDYLISLSSTPTDGATLYANNCASCHGATTNSTKIGATVTRINNGITNEASMNSLGTSLTAANITAISDYLISLSSSTPTDGATLYTNNCASCHGAGSNSAKVGATVTRINNGISSVTSMNYLGSTLTAANIQAIADYLATVAPPTTAQGLYTAYCASCHGADGSGGTSGENVLGESTGGILDAIDKEEDMQYLSFITNEQAKLISDFLNGVAPPVSGTGETLYATNCAGCHGTGANSTKAGATVARINSGISSVSSMNYFSSTLSTADIQAISDYLISVGSTNPPSTGGEALYTTNCSGCHGAANNSAKAGATVARINSGISGVSSMNYLGSTLSTADIQAIADFLASTSAPTTPEGLYMTYCSSCHGTDASGGSSGKNVQGDSASSIQKAIDKESEMRYLDFLNSDQVRAIAQHLDTL